MFPIPQLLSAIQSTLSYFTSDPYTVTDSQAFPDDSYAGIKLYSDGTIRSYKPLGEATIGRWDNGAGGLTMSDYDFMFETTDTLNISGGSTKNVWHTGGSTILFGVTETGSGTTSATGTLKIRLTGVGSGLDSATATVTAESS